MAYASSTGPSWKPVTPSMGRHPAAAKHTTGTPTAGRIGHL
jgi:hypothetical protein